MSGQNRYLDAADRIYHEWNEALKSCDLEALLSLYAEDAVLESPLIPHLLNTERGICEGKSSIQGLVEQVFERKPALRQFYRTPCLKLGSLIIWEYPRETPQGEQMDFVEVIQINSAGLIQSHRVYWGWRGVKVLSDNAYHHD